MKIVLNKRYGGFGLSDEGAKYYASLVGMDIEQTDFGVQLLWHGENFSQYDIKRTDPALVATVEELGDAANGLSADLKVIDILSGDRYRIREYDGIEWIEFEHEVKWETAT